MALNGEDGKKIREAIERFGTNLKKDISVTAPFDKTKNGRITKVSPTGYTVEIENKEYTNVKAINANVLAENDIVVCKLPNNQMSQMYIIGKLVGQVEADGNAGKVKDVQINGTSIVVDHIANILVDSSPTQNSTHLITSGGVYTALQGKQDTLTFDDVPTQNSNNPVKSGGVYNATCAKVYRNLAALSTSLSSSSSLADICNSFTTNNTIAILHPAMNANLAPSGASSSIGLTTITCSTTDRIIVEYTADNGERWICGYRKSTSTLYDWVKVASVQKDLQNPTFLPNGDLSVNLMGQSTYQHITGVVVDGNWYLYQASGACKVTLNTTAGGALVDNSGGSTFSTFRQYFRNYQALSGKTITVSCYVRSVTGAVRIFISGLQSSTQYSSNLVTGLNSITLTASDTPTESQMGFNLPSGAKLDFAYLKAEIGSIATAFTPTNLPIEQGALYAYNNAIDITGLTVDLNSLTFSSGYPYCRRYICKTSGGSSNITNKPVSNVAFILDVDLIRYASASDYIVRQTYAYASNIDMVYVRTCTNGTWGNWYVSPYRRIVPMCNSSGGSINKVVSQPAYTAQEGNLISVYFVNANTVANATLNINSTGAYPIYVNGSAATGASGNLPAGWHTFYFDGSRYLTGTHSLPVESVNAVAWTDVNITFPLSSASASDSKVLSEKAVYTEAVALDDKISKCAHLNGSWTQIKQYNQAFTSGFTLGIGTYEFYVNCPMYSANGYAWQYGTMTVWDLNIAYDILSTRFNLFHTAAYDIFICRDTNGSLSIVDKYGTNNDGQSIMVYYRKL